MYERIFNLNSRPFTSTPFVENYFAAESIHQALAQCRLCIERASGPVIVTGTPGTGKSLLLAMLAEQFKSDYRITSLVCARLVERKDLLQNILFELGLNYRDMSEGELRLSLIDYLKSDECADKGVLLLVDEAHSLSHHLLDELRLITNFVRVGTPLVSLVMAGSPSLEDHLIETKSESFNQRIASRCYLTNLSQNETIEYVLTHIERAGAIGEELFTGEALKVVHQASDGCPRVINQICDYALVLAASMDADRVTAEIVGEAWNDVQCIPGSMPTDLSTATSKASNGKTENDNDLNVIEFGHLEDDSESTSNSTADSSKPISGFEFVAGSQDNNSYLPVCDDLNESPAAKTFCCENDCESDEETASVSASADFDYSITGDSDETDNAANYENPFDESFAEEEHVRNDFFPAVSEQNLSALTLKPEHLGLLDDLQPVVAADVECGSEKNRVDDDAGLELIDRSNTVDSNEDLRLTSSQLSDLDRVEEDVQRLQKEFAASELNEARLASQPDCDTTCPDQPVEEFVQHFPISVENVMAEQIIDLRAVSSAENDSVDDSTRDDDQDMMIIHRADPGLYDDEQSKGMDQQSDQIASTGSAERMDYQELFRQLRSGD